MNSNVKLVFSTDPKENQACPRCKELFINCSCQKAEAVVSRNFVVIFRIETKGRGGKMVTVMDGFPKNESFLKELTKEFKIKCGTGGTYDLSGKEGRIEIQGDKRVQLKNFLKLKAIKFKGQ